MMYVLEINERAIGKQRPGFNSIKKIAYTPRKTKEFEEYVGWTFREKYKLEKPSEKPFKVCVNAIFKPSQTAIKNNVKLIRKAIYKQARCRQYSQNNNG